MGPLKCCKHGLGDCKQIVKWTTQKNCIRSITLTSIFAAFRHIVFMNNGTKLIYRIFDEPFPLNIRSVTY